MRFSLPLIATLVGCGPAVAPADDGPADSTTATAGDDGGPSSLSSGTTPPGDDEVTSGTPPSDSTGDPPEGTDTGFTSSDFIDDPTAGCLDDPPPGTAAHCTLECSTFLQDCPEGEKCMPWSNDGGPTWNTTRCSPVADDPGQVYEPCTAEGSGVSGVDDCDVGLMCWNVDDELQGYCMPLCGGSPSEPVCPDEFQCSLTGNGSLALCLPTCDPLVQDCPAGEECVPYSDGFVCATDLDDAAPGEACEYVNACAPEAACVDAQDVPGCTSASCCTSFCNLESADPDAVCLLGQACQSWWEAGAAPPGYEHVGICVAP
jgi:hypothetical protein